MAWSPGGKSCTLSLMATPTADCCKVALPTFLPWPFCNFTTWVGVLALLAHAPANMHSIAPAIAMNRKLLLPCWFVIRILLNSWIVPFLTVAAQSQPQKHWRWRCYNRGIDAG